MKTFGQVDPQERLRLLSAFKEGKQIQTAVLKEGGGIDFWYNEDTPLFYEDTCYRVRPEKVVRWVNVYISPLGSLILGEAHESRQAADEALGSLAQRIGIFRIEKDEKSLEYFKEGV